MKQEKILIADDEPYVLDVCRRILEKDYQVKIVHSGLEAIQVIQHERFDLLLTDIKMPGIDGLDTAREVKKIIPDIVCITMTGFSTMETAIKALRLGIDEFVIKPFAPEELSLAIERALEKERLRKENIRLKSLLPLFEFNKSLMSTVDTRLQLEQVLALATSETQADAALLYTVNERQDLILFTNINVSPKQLEAFETSKYLAIEQLKTDLLQINIGNLSYPRINSLLADMKMKNIMSVPLTGKEQKLLGALVLFKREKQFSQSELNVLSVMAGQASTAYQNARLIEDLQLAYDKLKTLDHLKSEFINVAAHELRTPLAILLGYATVMEEDVTGDHKTYIDTIIRNAMRLRTLIDDLLNMRHLESGQLALKIIPVDISTLLTQAVADMSVLAKEKDIDINVDLPATTIVLQSDRQQLELVITNLLANAIKFTPRNGNIKVKGRVSNESLTIWVADSGIGIPEQEHTKIFDRFYQVENSLNREHDGIGLGLAIVKGIIERFSGEIQVKSVVGKGSTFIITLPLR